MSTAYYPLRAPYTHVEVSPHPHALAEVCVWIRDVPCGRLSLPKDEVVAFLRFLARESALLHTYWGGPTRGTVVVDYAPWTPADTVVVSEYDELLTVGQVRARRGARRSDGLPTELFGYEPPTSEVTS